MRKSRSNSLVVPSPSWDLIQGSLDSVIESDTMGKRCNYRQGASEVDSETAQVPLSGDSSGLSGFLTLMIR